MYSLEIRTHPKLMELSDQQLAEVAFQGLLPHIKEKYASQEFYNISQMANRIIGEARPYEQKRSNF